MSKGIRPDQLADAIAQELTLYSKEVTGSVNEEGRKAIKKMVKLSKANAPEGKRGRFKKSISSREDDAGQGTGDKKFTWFVKAPDHRLTHLLVHGHATKDGGRTKPDPFLQNAVDAVLPEYEKAVEEAIKK